jgi:hypothetical protein
MIGFEVVMCRPSATAISIDRRQGNRTRIGTSAGESSLHGCSVFQMMVSEQNTLFNYILV